MKSKHNYSRRHFINHSCTAILAAGITSVGCSPGSKPNPNPGPGPDPSVKGGTKIKRFVVDRTIVFGGQSILFTVELAANASANTEVKFESDQPGLIQMPTVQTVSGVTQISRMVGTTDLTNTVKVTAIIGTERVTHVITVVDGSRTRAYQPFPQAPQTMNVRWFPGLISGGSFNLNSVTAGGAVIVSDNLVPIDISGDRTTLSVKENASSSQISQGREVDLNLAGRLFAVKGSLTSYIDTSSSQSTNQYSLTVDYRVIKGKAAVDMPKETFDRLQLKYLADPNGFESVYGTHYVSAVDRECYVRATYSLSVTSAESARKADLTISASGEWVAGSFSANRSVSERLKLLSSSSSISINVETNAQNTVQANIIGAPSEVDKVLDEISAIQTACNSATPVVSGYYLSKWSELFQQVGSNVDRGVSTRRAVTRDLIQRLRQKSTLTPIVSEKAKYAYYGDLIRYYEDSLTKVNGEIIRLRSLLENLNNGDSGLTYEPTDLGIEFDLVTPQVTFKTHPQGNGSDKLLQPNPLVDDRSWSTVEFDFDVVGISGDVRFRISNEKNADEYYFGDSAASKCTKIVGQKPSDSVLKCRFSKKFTPFPGITWLFANDPLFVGDFFGNPYHSGTGWQLDLVDQRGLVICSVPLPAR